MSGGEVAGGGGFYAAKSAYLRYAEEFNARGGIDRFPERDESVDGLLLAWGLGLPEPVLDGPRVVRVWRVAVASRVPQELRAVIVGRHAAQRRLGQYDAGGRPVIHGYLTARSRNDAARMASSPGVRRRAADVLEVPVTDLRYPLVAATPDRVLVDADPTGQGGEWVPVADLRSSPTPPAQAPDGQPAGS